MADIDRGLERQVLDPVHGYIRIPAALQPLVDHPAFQRLRRTSQTALVVTVYPGANGTRFEHALGAMHLAQYAFHRAWATSSDARDLLTSAARTQLGLGDRSQSGWRDLLSDTIAASALLHDIGHPPFSHALEEVYRTHRNLIFSEAPVLVRLFDESEGNPFHETAGSALTERMMPHVENEDLKGAILAVYNAAPNDGSWAGALKGIVAGELDVDRLDYLMRDAHHAGTEYGAIDWRRLLEALEFHIVEGRLILGAGIRARSACETLLVQRTQAYKWVYHHPRVVAVELFLRRAIDLMFSFQGSNASVVVGGSTTTVGAIATAIAPNLNYLSSTSQSFGRAVSLIGLSDQLMTDPVDLLPLDPDHWRQISEEVAAEIEAGVDDGVVVGALRRLALLLTYVTGDPSHPDQANAERYLHYYRAALHRSSSFLSAWKRYEEYVDVAEQLAAGNELSLAIDFAFSTVQRQLAPQESAAEESISTGRNARLLTELGALRASFADMSPVSLLNRLGSLLIQSSNSDLPQHLDDSYPSPSPGVTGFWECTYRDFSAASLQERRSVLWEGRGRAVPLVDTSPLVAALPLVEKERIKFFVYFIRTRDRSGPSASSSGFRRKLRDAFVKAFPVFVRDTLAAVIKETIFLEFNEEDRPDGLDTN